MYAIDAVCLHCLNDMQAKYDKVKHLWDLNSEEADVIIEKGEVYEEPEFTQKEPVKAMSKREITKRAFKGWRGRETSKRKLQCR